MAPTFQLLRPHRQPYLPQRIGPQPYHLRPHCRQPRTMRLLHDPAVAAPEAWVRPARTNPRRQARKQIPFFFFFFNSQVNYPPTKRGLAIFFRLLNPLLINSILLPVQIAKCWRSPQDYRKKGAWLPRSSDGAPQAKEIGPFEEHEHRRRHPRNGARTTNGARRTRYSRGRPRVSLSRLCDAGSSDEGTVAAQHEREGTSAADH